MVKIEFLGPIKRPNLELDISNLQELKEVLQKDEELSNWLEICSIAINDEIVIDPNSFLNDGDRVTLLPPVCGG